jgi:hypothetical protein
LIIDADMSAILRHWLIALTLMLSAASHYYAIFAEADITFGAWR